VDPLEPIREAIRLRLPLLSPRLRVCNLTLGYLLAVNVIGEF